LKRDVRLYLDDILESIQAIEEYTEGITYQQFNTNRLLQDGVVRRLEIIGEAARHLPKDLTDRYSDIPWRRIAGMRNRLTHEYFGILLERVWEVIERDLPILKVNIRKMIEHLS
jgi:uncharacterized protein with HEPN domain